jgi:predicted acylesterase/phospholipase RssA
LERAGDERGGGNLVSWPGGELLKRVLYISPSEEILTSLLRRVAEVGGPAERPFQPRTLSDDGVQIRFTLTSDPREAMELLRDEIFPLVIFDLRVATAEHSLDRQAADAFRVLDFLGRVDAERRHSLSRVLALVGGDGDTVDQLIAAFGARGVGRILRDPSSPGEKPAFAQLLLGEVRRMMLERRPGKNALCLAGGGITGIYFEIGALKCLDDCTGGEALHRFDMYFGISAGAVVAGVLANGYSPDELMAAIAGVEGGRMGRLSLSLLHLGNMNFADLSRRAVLAWRDAANALWAIARRRGKLGDGSIFRHYSDWVSPPFRANRFERALRRLFSVPGTTNDFRSMPRKLFIGATDQDTRTHVLFGDAGYDQVPVSLAIQGSASMNPAFTSTAIASRYYTDGAVTKTSNYLEAIRRGADLVFLVDPFVPYVSKEPGYARQRGFLYNIDQDIRAMSYTRFETSRIEAMRRHPDVSLYSFLPGNRERQLLSVNPMDHRPYLAIWRGAYLSTLRRIQFLEQRMRPDLFGRGIVLDTRRAEEVAARLQSSSSLQFADFFADGRIEIKRPPLCLEGQSSVRESAAGLAATHAA